jgi:uncharacterized membrane protein YfcA
MEPELHAIHTLAPYLFATLGAFVAGLVDAIVGGGGLIQLPLLMVLFPGVPIPVLLGTNKVASCCGTLSAAISFAKRIQMPWALLRFAMPIAFVASGLGACLATVSEPQAIKPVIFGLLVGVLLFTLLRPAFGTQGEATFELTRRKVLLGSLLCLVIGVYDGFLGPGTGSFLIFGFVALLSVPFVQASGFVKWINLATNVAAVGVFVASGAIDWWLAIPMGVSNLAGGYLGARLALLKGAGFVRKIFLMVVSLLLARLGWDLFLQ